MSDFFSTISERLESLFNPRNLSTMAVDGLMNLTLALSVLAAFYIVWWMARRAMRFALRPKVDATTFSFIETTIKFSLFVIATISALDAIGVKTSALLTSLGIVGLTIGFAARDALSNLISGILIFLDRPFVLGDLVEIEGTYGRVDRITLRSTRVVTSDGRMLAVPNTEVINKTVASYTNFANLRISVSVTVGVDEDIDAVRKILLSLVADDADYMTDPPPRVVLTELNDYNNALELQAWISEERRHVEKRYELREKVYKALTSAGVDMPFQTLELKPVEVKTVSNG